MGRLTDTLICALAVVIAVLGGRAAGPVLQSLAAKDGALRGIILQAPAFGGADRVRVLLIGADKREGDHGRSDTLLLLTLNPRTHRVALLGLPRDLLVAVPGHGQTKINHAYAYGGADLTRRTVSDFVGLKIDYHALIFFEGFMHAVDALGGVTVNVPDVEGHGRGMNYDDNAGDLHIHLKPGRQHLNGRQALGFVRYRKSNTHGLGDNDEARSGRQQQFLRAVADQHLRATSLPGLLAAARVVEANTQTDLTPAAVTDLVRTFHGCDRSRVLTATVPLAASGWQGHGTYYAHPDMPALRRVLAKFEAHLDSGSPTPAVVEALNVSGLTGRARDAGSRLASRGFKVARVGNANQSDRNRTVIEFRPGRERDAKRARAILGCGETCVAAPGSAAEGAPDIRVYIGRDYRP